MMGCEQNTNMKRWQSCIISLLHFSLSSGKSPSQKKSRVMCDKNCMSMPLCFYRDTAKLNSKEEMAHGSE